MTKKELILKTAAELFAEKGFAETSIDQIAADAGVAKGTIFYHFNTKADLLAEIMKETFAAYKKRLDSVRLSDKPAIEKIVDFTQCGYDLLEEKYYEIKTLMRDAPHELAGDTDNEVARTVRSCVETTTRIYAEVFEQGMKDGSVRKQDPREAAIILDSLLHGSVKRMLLLPVETPDLSRSIAEIARFAFGANPQ